MTTFTKEKDIIKKFIEERLQKKLEKDQKELKILSEGDLQSCVYHHLRVLFRKKKISEIWYLTNKLPMGKQRKDKIFPDIVIMRMKDKKLKEKGNVVKPVFLIELKEHSKYVSSSVKSDLQKLAKAYNRWKHLQQSYFILAAPDENMDSKTILQKMETIRKNAMKEFARLKHRDRIIPIPVNAINTIKGPEYVKWKTKYKELRKPTSLR